MDDPTYMDNFVDLIERASKGEDIKIVVKKCRVFEGNPRDLEYLEIPAYLRKNVGHPDACRHGFFTCLQCGKGNVERQR